MPFFELDKNISLIKLSSQHGLYKKRDYIKYIRRLRMLMKKHQPTHIIDVCSSMSLISIPASVGLNTKVITWEHFNITTNWNGIITPFARWLASNYSYRIVTLTTRDANAYKQKFNAKNVECIPNPITMDIKSHSGLKNKIVLAIGRFTEQKGFDLLLKSWNKCKCKDNDWKLKIVGDGELKKSIEALIETLNLRSSVTLYPATKNISQFYTEASLFVMSSRFEGLPLVLIEAMAHGLPIVSFNCPTGPQEIVKDGYTGYLVDNFDTELLATRIDEITADKNKLNQFSINSLKESKRFSIDEILIKWFNLLDVC